MRMDLSSKGKTKIPDWLEGCGKFASPAPTLSTPIPTKPVIEEPCIPKIDNLAVIVNVPCEDEQVTTREERLFNMVKACKRYPCVQAMADAMREFMITPTFSVDEFLTVVTNFKSGLEKLCREKLGKTKTCLQLLASLEYILPAIHEVYETQPDLQVKKAAYLVPMTELMSIYLDVQICYSNLNKLRGKSLRRIGQEMSNALVEYLLASEPHIFEAVLLARLISKNDSELLHPLLRKILSDAMHFLHDEAAYLRSVLMFRLFRQFQPTEKDRYAVFTTAREKLKPSYQIQCDIRKPLTMIGLASKCSRELTGSLIATTRTEFNKLKEMFFDKFAIVTAARRNKERLAWATAQLALPAAHMVSQELSSMTSQRLDYQPVIKASDSGDEIEVLAVYKNRHNVLTLCDNVDPPADPPPSVPPTTQTTVVDMPPTKTPPSLLDSHSTTVPPGLAGLAMPQTNCGSPVQGQPDSTTSPSQQHDGDSNATSFDMASASSPESSLSTEDVPRPRRVSSSARPPSQEMPCLTPHPPQTAQTSMALTPFQPERTWSYETPQGPPIMQGLWPVANPMAHALDERRLHCEDPPLNCISREAPLYFRPSRENKRKQDSEVIDMVKKARYAEHSAYDLLLTETLTADLSSFGIRPVATPEFVVASSYDPSSSLIGQHSDPRSQLVHQQTRGPTQEYQESDPQCDDLSELFVLCQNPRPVLPPMSPPISPCASPSFSPPCQVFSDQHKLLNCDSILNEEARISSYYQSSLTELAITPSPKRGRGRPRGSKNKRPSTKSPSRKQKSGQLKKKVK